MAVSALVVILTFNYTRTRDIKLKTRPEYISDEPACGNGKITRNDEGYLVDAYIFTSPFYRVSHAIKKKLPSSVMCGASKTWHVAPTSQSELSALCEIANKNNLYFTSEAAALEDDQSKSLPVGVSAPIEVSIRQSNSSWIIKVHKYRASHIEAIKSAFSSKQRSYLGSSKEWVIADGASDLASKISDLLRIPGWNGDTRAT